MFSRRTHEMGELTYKITRPGFIIIPVTYAFYMNVIGPWGRYIRYEDSPRFLMPFEGDMIHEESLNFAQDSLNWIIEHIKSDGWHSIDERGEHWYNHRFVREWNPDRFAWEEGREVLAYLEKRGIEIATTPSGEIQVLKGRLNREESEKIKYYRYFVFRFLQDSEKKSIQTNSATVEARSNKRALIILALMWILVTFTMYFVIAIRSGFNVFPPDPMFLSFVFVPVLILWLLSKLR